MANLGRAMPSLALIGIAVPFTPARPAARVQGLPTLIAMVVLGIPPILVNTYAGITEVDPELTEAARGMGLTERQVLRGLEVPLALAVIIAGIGSAAVQIIATATLGAIFGFGGLGAYLVEGIAQNDDGMMFGGRRARRAARAGGGGAVRASSRGAPCHRGCGRRRRRRWPRGRPPRADPPTRCARTKAQRARNVAERVPDRS